MKEGRSAVSRAPFFSDAARGSQALIRLRSHRKGSISVKNVGSALTIEHCGVGCDPQTEGHMRRCEFITLIGGATASRPCAPRGTWVAARCQPLVAKSCNKIAARRLDGWL